MRDLVEALTKESALWRELVAALISTQNRRWDQLAQENAIKSRSNDLEERRNDNVNRHLDQVERQLAVEHDESRKS